MKKIFIFDMGNVIIKWDPNYIICQFTDDPIVHQIIKNELFASKYWLMFDHGTITKDNLKIKVNQSINPKYHQITNDIIDNWYRHAPVIDEMHELIKMLHDHGHKIYLLSNTSIQFDEYKDSIPTFKYFSGFYISARTKLVKPTKEIFVDFLKTFNLKAGNCIFIDDINENVEGAKLVGIDGYCFDGDVKKFKSYLENHHLI